MGYIIPPSEISLHDPSNEPIFEVIETNTINDGRRAVGMVVLDPLTAVPVGPSTPQVVSDVAETCAAGRLDIGSSPVQVLPADTLRTCATLRNLGPDSVELVATDSALLGTGFVIHLGDAFDVRSKAAVFALTATNAVVSLWVERAA